ncbi:hypothetical protein WJX81_000648 [Elliptochloris bilobata]|uniref:Uncharacterized protein n=1 Tax=Elliptochloris bilobata TaxID=381761 RepID=A0AAW1SL21_9CHLO
MKDALSFGEELSPQALAQLAAGQYRNMRFETHKAYKKCFRKWEWFLKHKTTNLVDDMTTPVGVKNAVEFLTWIGQHFPGYDGPQRAAELGPSLFKQIHAALTNLYKRQQVAAGWDKMQTLLDQPAYFAAYHPIWMGLGMKGERANKP